MNSQTPAELNVPTGFDGPVNVARVNADLIFDATIVEWTDHGIVIVYDKTASFRLRQFVPFATLSGISVVVNPQDEA